MAILLLQERLRLMPLTLRDGTLLQEEKVHRDLSHRPDLEAGPREDSAAALVPVATVQVAQGVFIPRRTMKSLRRGVSLVFVL